MHPILFRIGSFQLPTYGVILASALIVGLIVAVRLGRKEGFDPGHLLDFSVWLILSGLVGAKIYMFFTDWRSGIPIQLFSLGTLEAGGGIYGGFIGGVVFALVYVKLKHWPWGKIFDAFAPGLAIGQCIGRWGCFAAGDDFGKRTPPHSIWGVVYHSQFAHAMTGIPLGVPLYPVQLFESGLMLIAFLALLWLYGRKTRDGQIFVAYMMMYGGVRFFDGFLRGDTDRGFFFHHFISTAQLCAIVAFATGCVMLFILHRRAPGGVKLHSAQSEEKRMVY